MADERIVTHAAQVSVFPKAFVLQNRAWSLGPCLVEDDDEAVVHDRPDMGAERARPTEAP